MAPAPRRAFFEQLVSKRDAVTARVTDYPLADGDAQKPYLIQRVNAFFDAAQTTLNGL